MDIRVDGTFLLTTFFFETAPVEIGLVGGILVYLCELPILQVEDVILRAHEHSSWGVFEGRPAELTFEQD